MSKFFKNNKWTKSAGFTLAEVLITLGIIGVVAALTIPALIAEYQKTQYVTALKKFYVEFNQVLTKFAADSNCPGDLYCTGLFEGDTSNMDVYNNNVGDELMKYMKLNINGRAGGCYPNPAFLDENPYHNNYDGSDTEQNSCWQGYQVTTIDGMNVKFYFKGCKATGTWGRGVTHDLDQICGTVDVDINGSKKPNTWGRDIFRFFIANGRGAKLYPCGGIDGDGFGNYWRDNNGNPQHCYPGEPNGMLCAGRIMEDGWEMKY